ncbi:MAG: hypothetical protein IJF63_03085 [Alistipes sp.]|nr:hypothetical protein [Alistipes sp.]
MSVKRIVIATIVATISVGAALAQSPAEVAVRVVSRTRRPWLQVAMPRPLKPKP